MLTEKDLDIIMQKIQSNKDAYVYYVAHMIEPREGWLDEHSFKSNAQFKIIKLKVVNIQNAYFEYLNFIENPENYHVEQEECYYDYRTKYIHYYSVPNAKSNYSKEFTPRMPSLIYGYRRKIFDMQDHTEKEINDPSPIKVHYPSCLEYGDYTTSQVQNAYNNNKLAWKYRKLAHTEIVDDTEYRYISSYWYILDIENFPTVEKPLINVKQYNSYFMDLMSAYNYLLQLKA